MQFFQDHIIYAFIKRHGKMVFMAFVIGLLANAMTIFIPIMITMSYGVLFNIEATKAQFFLEWLNIELTLQRFFLLFFGSIFLKGVFDFLIKYQLGKIGEQLIFELRCQLFEHQLQVNMTEYDKRGIGRYLLRYSGDLSSIYGYLTKGIIRFVADALMLILTLSIIWTISWELSSLLLAWFGLTAVVINYLNNILYNITEKRRNRKSNLLSFVNQRLLSMLSLQTFNKEKPELKKFYRRSELLNDLGRDYQRMASFIQSLIPLMMYAMIGILFLFVVFTKNNETLALNGETMLLMVLMIISLLPFFRRLLGVSMVWKKGQISIRKLHNILELNTNEYKECPDLLVENGRMCVENLHFNYSKGTDIFKNVSFTIEPNKINFIKGTSGSGKTTLIKLLTAIYYPTVGQIVIDRQSSTSINPKSWRKQVAVVADEWQLYGKTVLEAISYGKGKKYKKRANRILAELQAESKEPLTITDQIGEFGNQLSKSQRKVLMYARALMTRKPILIIDNPFDGMDQSLQSQFGDFLNKWKEKHTIILLGSEKPEMKIDHLIELNNEWLIETS